jgi:peptidoglycan/LPS O-acetylase OafA/YrhL
MKKNNNLEALRAIAAIYVFFHHTLYNFEILEKGSIIWRLFSFGQEAVIIFFLLSGYVITLSMYKNNYGFITYFKHRLLRIYSVVFIAYLVSFVTYILILKNPFPEFETIIFNLFMLQDKVSFNLGNFAIEPIFNNQPLWSLTYEWWFYMIFFIHYKFAINFSINKNILLAFIISSVGISSYYFIPNQFSSILIYYYMWFSGGVLYYIYKNETIYTKEKFYLLFGFIGLILFYSLLFIVKSEYIASVVFPHIKLRHYISALLFVFILFIFYKPISFILKKRFIEKILLFFIKLAPISFSIYAIHYPIMEVFETIEINKLLKLILTLVITLFFAYLAEIKLYKYLRRRYL